VIFRVLQRMKSRGSSWIISEKREKSFGSGRRARILSSRIGLSLYFIFFEWYCILIKLK